MTARVGGIICANTDDTQRIINERQMQLLRELAARTADARTRQEACRLSALSIASDLRTSALRSFMSQIRDAIWSN